MFHHSYCTFLIIEKLGLSEIPVYNVYAACGFGTENGIEYQIDTMLLPSKHLNHNSLPFQHARIITTTGDSMESTLSDDDQVLVDIRELEHPCKTWCLCD